MTNNNRTHGISSISGRVYLVGIGPGTPGDMTFNATEAIKKADTIVGNKPLVERLGDTVRDKEIIDRDMTPVQRTGIAIEKSKKGRGVAIVSAGDPGIYAIASTFFGYLKRNKVRVNVEVIPGVTTATAAAALLGSPLCHDFAVISLADQLTSWAKTRERLEAAAKSGMVIAIYNPKGKTGNKRFEKALTILRLYCKPGTIVGIVTSAEKGFEAVKILKLREVSSRNIEDNSIVIVGNSRTSIYDGWMITMRDYKEGVGY